MAAVFGQSPGNLVRGYTFEFTFTESDGVAPAVDEVDEYLIVERTNNRSERIGQADGEDYLWNFTYAKVPPRGATLDLEIDNPPDQSDVPEEEREPYYVTQGFTMEFSNPFEGTFTYTVTDSEDQTGTASGTFVLVRGPWQDLQQDPGSGWANSQWYGNVYVIGYPWCFQEEEGWVYVNAEEQNDMWQYREGVAWHWTAEGTFPWCYEPDGENPGEGRWLFLYTGDPDSEFTVFFIGGTDQTIVLPK